MGSDVLILGLLGALVLLIALTLAWTLISGLRHAPDDGSVGTAFIAAPCRTCSEEVVLTRRHLTAEDVVLWSQEVRKRGTYCADHAPEGREH